MKQIEICFFQKGIPYENEKDNGPSLIIHSTTELSEAFLMPFIMPDLVKDTQLANDSQVIDLKPLFSYLENLQIIHLQSKYWFHNSEGRSELKK